MYNELYQMYGKPPGAELQELIHLFHTCKQGDGASVSDHFLLMKSYLDQLASLNYTFDDKIAIGFIVESLTILPFQDQEASTTKERASGKRRTVSPLQGGRTLEAELSDISSRVEKEEEWTNGCLYIFRDLEDGLDIAAAETAKEAVWIRKFVDELGVVPSNNYPICDNTAAISMAKEPGIMKGARHF
nr:retrovirus-related Pol polyprotein from transposon TNT 1-94 [Tanacetum cinerariifolium]